MKSPSDMRVGAASQFGEAELAAFYAQAGVTAHPFVKLPTVAWLRAAMAQDPAQWQLRLRAALEERDAILARAEADPLNHGFEFEPWAHADALLKGEWTQSSTGYRPPPADVLAIFGGNRASKTVYATKRATETAELCPGSKIMVMAEKEDASIATVQSLVWMYLKPKYAPLNGKRDAVFKINFSQAGGFTDGKLVLPNGSEMHFRTYNQNPGDYEGWEFGAPATVYSEVAAARAKEGLGMPPNMGAVADESMPLAWLKMFARRLRFRHSRLLWTFTPVKGITPAIKELKGISAKTLEGRASELLPRKNVDDLPAGQMPYIQECQYAGVKAMAIYFFSLFNRFGPEPGRTYYDEVKGLCAGKESGYIERVAYGYARDSVAKAFPKFGPVNVVRAEHLPAVRSNYMITDPAGRNWATIWVGVTPDGAHYIYRDWPDAQTYGEWAVPTEREVNEQNMAGWDGDPGPAQAGLGLGIVGYKRVFVQAETIDVPMEVIRLTPGELAVGLELLAKRFPDPHRRELALRAWGAQQRRTREVIVERYVDPRAGANEHIAEKGGTCIMDEFGERQFDGKGNVIGEEMELNQASGVRIEEGMTMVNELLDWNPEEPLMPVMNAPKLYVSAECLQVIWMFANYTGRGGMRGAAKDFADVVRYMALADLQYVGEGQLKGRPGRGF